VQVLRVAKVNESEEIYNEGSQDVGSSQNNIFVFPVKKPVPAIFSNSVAAKNKLGRWGILFN